MINYTGKFSYVESYFSWNTSARYLIFIMDNQEETYSFCKSSEFCFGDREELKIHTVGKIVYYSNRICLESLSNNQHIDVTFLCKSIPEDGTFVHLYGILKNYVSKDNYTKKERRIHLELYFCNDLGCYQRAKTLEKILYEVNKK